MKKSLPYFCAVISLSILITILVLFYKVPAARNVSKLDTWQYIGEKSLRYKVFSAYFDDREEAFGTYYAASF